MLMVIFGAGASFDSFPSLPAPNDHPDRPPLAPQLFSGRAEFNNVLRNYPDCQTIVPYLRVAEASLEQRLAGFQDEAATNPARHRQLAAVRYYLQEMLWGCETRWRHFTYGVSNYRTFIDQIVAWTPPEEEIYLVTFNYDRLLEWGMSTVGIRIRQMGDYISDPKFKLIKLHGSTDWARPISGRWDELGQITGRDVVNAVIARAAQLEIGSEFVITGMSPIDKLNERALFPAIAVPVQNKGSFECPTEQSQLLLEGVQKVTKLIIIGWRGAEDYFKKLLAERLTGTVPTLIVSESTNTAIETLGNLTKSGIRTVDTPFGNGFTQFVVTSRAHPFLARLR